jgi:hypothetical protein
VKAGERSACRLEMSGVNTYATLDVDLTTGTVVAAGTYAMQLDGGLDRTYQPDGSWIGWYRLWVTQSAAPAGSYVVLYMQAAPGGSTSYLGDITKGLYLWGGQLVFANWQGIYTPTTDTAWRLGIGSLAEPRQNYLQYSGDLSNAIWVPTNVAVVGNTTDTTDPWGGNTATKITATGAGSVQHLIRQNISWVRPPQRTMVTSCWTKAGTARYLSIGFDGHTPYYRTWWDFQTRTFVSTTANTTAGAVVYPDGWYRIWVKYVVPATDAFHSAEGCAICPTPTAGVWSYVQAGETVYVVGAQMNVANYLPVYSPTALYPMRRAIRSTT